MEESSSKSVRSFLALSHNTHFIVHSPPSMLLTKQLVSFWQNIEFIFSSPLLKLRQTNNFHMTKPNYSCDTRTKSRSRSYKRSHWFLSTRTPTPSSTRSTHPLKPMPHPQCQRHLPTLSRSHPHFICKYVRTRRLQGLPLLLSHDPFPIPPFPTSNRGNPHQLCYRQCAFPPTLQPPFRCREGGGNLHGLVRV